MSSFHHGQEEVEQTKPAATGTGDSGPEVKDFYQVLGLGHCYPDVSKAGLFHDMSFPGNTCEQSLGFCPFGGAVRPGDTEPRR